MNLDFNGCTVEEVFDDVIRSQLRNIRIQTGRDPKELRVSQGFYREIAKEYAPQRRLPTPFEGHSIYGIPIVITDKEGQGFRWVK